MRRNNVYDTNALNKEERATYTKAISRAFHKAENAARNVLRASGKVKQIDSIMYNETTDHIARNAIRNASDASWTALLAAQKTYQRGNETPATKEKQAAQKSYKLQALMSEISTNMDELISTKKNGTGTPLRNMVYEKVLRAKTQAEDARKTWEQLLPHNTSQEAGGRKRDTLRKKTLHGNRKSRSRRSHL